MSNKLSSTYILRELEQRGLQIFSAREFRLIFGFSDPRNRQILHRLSAAGYIKRLGKRLYLVTGFGIPPAMASPSYLGTRLVEPSYVSFWSAFHYYGWTEQVPRLTLLATTRPSQMQMIDRYGFRFVHMNSRRFFGYQKVRDGSLDFPLASPEKAALDSLLLPNAAGGMEHVLEGITRGIQDIEVSRLVDYARRMGSRSLASRLGYLLSSLGIEVGGLLHEASRVYVKLCPERARRGRHDTKWKVIINLPEDR